MGPRGYGLCVGSPRSKQAPRASFFYIFYYFRKFNYFSIWFIFYSHSIPYVDNMNSINRMRMRCSQFCITKLISYFSNQKKKIHTLFKVSKDLKEPNCLFMFVCAPFRVQFTMARDTLIIF